MRNIDYPREIERIACFMREYLSISQTQGYLLGVSGGMDSALVQALAVHALGKDKVKAIIMPYKNSNPNSEADAMKLCKTLNVDAKVIDISPMVDAYYSAVAPDASALRKGNFMARIRMNILFDLSAEYRYLVLGTGNKSEWLSGYFTQFGDAACALEPILHLYKTETYEMAKYFPIPREILDKTPSADLWEGQSDEQEMGISYLELDAILFALETKQSLSVFPPDKVKLVFRLQQNSSFKRLPIPSMEAPCLL